MSYGRPTLSGTSRTPFNRFAKQNSSTETSSQSNGQVGVKTNGKRNGYHPYQSTEPKVRRDAIHRLTKGYELPDLIPPPISDAVASEIPSEDAPREFTFTPDYTYFRQLEQEEHKGRGESSSTTSFAQPDFSTFYTTGLDKHTDTVRTVAWNTTGQYLATGSVDRVVYIWELSTTSGIRLHKELKLHNGSIDQLCWDPKNPFRLATASSDKTVRVWNAQTGDTLHLISTPGENINICWSPDGNFLAVGNKSMTISFIDVEKSQIVKEHTQSGTINEITWNHSGAFFLLSTSHGDVTILNFPSLTHVITLPSHTASCFCLDIDPYGRYLATGGADGKVSIWCLRTLTCVVTYNNLNSSVRALSFSFDGQYLACGSEDDLIDITGEMVHQVEASRTVNSMAWHPSQYLLGFSVDAVRSESRNTTYVKVFGL